MNDRRQAARAFAGADRRLFPAVDVAFTGLDVERREYTEPMFPGLWKAASPVFLLDLALVAWVLWS